MADTAFSTVNRSSTGSRAGCSPQGWGGCLVMQFLPPMPPAKLFTPGAAAAGPWSPPGMHPMLQLQKATLTAALAAHSPCPAARRFLLQPSQLNSTCKLLNPVLKHWALELLVIPWLLVIGPDGCRKMGWGRMELSWSVRRKVEGKPSPEKCAKVVILFGQKKETAFEFYPDCIRHSPESSVGWGSISISQPPKPRS